MKKRAKIKPSRLHPHTLANTRHRSNLMSERKAWFCPSCNKHHAPHVETCPGTVDALPHLPPTRLTVPSQIEWWEIPQSPYTGAPHPFPYTTTWIS